MSQLRIAKTSRARRAAKPNRTPSAPARPARTFLPRDLLVAGMIVMAVALLVRASRWDEGLPAFLDEAQPLRQALCFIEEGGEALVPSRCTDQKRHRHHNHSGDQEVTLQERSRPPRRGGRRSIRLGRTACAGCLRDSELRHARTLP